jgi:alanine racemase
MMDSFGSAGERFCFHGPAEGFGHGSVEVGDELFDFGAQCVLAGEIAAARSFRTRMENQISIWLSHEACLGVKWKVTRCSG